MKQKALYIYIYILPLTERVNWKISKKKFSAALIIIELLVLVVYSKLSTKCLIFEEIAQKPG